VGTAALVAIVCALAVQCVANAVVMLGHNKRAVVRYQLLGWLLVVADAVGAVAVWLLAYP